MVSAQTPSQKTLLAASKLSDAMRSDSIRSATITSSEAGTPENFKPRKSSPPAKRTGTGASGTAKTATGVDTTNVTFKPGDVVEIYGTMYVVGNDKKFYPIGGQQVPIQQQTVPNSGNNTAVFSDAVVLPQFGPNGEVLVYNPSTKTWDIPEGVKQAMSAQAQAGQTKSAGTQAGEDRPEAIALRSNEVLVNRRGDGQMELVLEERRRETKKVKRLYDLEENSPTSGSARAVEARNGLVSGSGSYFGGVGGATCGQTVVYNQRPPAVATYGTRGGDCWRARAVWNRGR